MKIEFNIKDRIYDKVVYDENKQVKEIKKIKLKASNFNKILSFMVNCMVQRGVDNNGYVEMSYKQLSKVIFNYKEYIDYLSQNGLIDVHRYYIKGKKSFGYRMTELFKRQLEIKSMVNEETDAYLDTFKVIKSNIKVDIKDETFTRLRKDYNFVELDWDFEKVEKPMDEWNKFIKIEKWFDNIFRLNRWDDNKDFFKLISGRLYSNFTYLSSVVRKDNIKLHGEYLKEFDITSSFPLMLCLYCQKVDKNIKKDYDFKQFCTHVINGKIYNQLTKGFNEIRNCNKEGLYDGDQIKENKNKKENNGESKYGSGDISGRLISRNEVKVLFQKWLN